MEDDTQRHAVDSRDPSIQNIFTRPQHKTEHVKRRYGCQPMALGHDLRLCVDFPGMDLLNVYDFPSATLEDDQAVRQSDWQRADALKRRFVHSGGYLHGLSRTALLTV